MFIQTQTTPNTHAVKFMPGREVMPNAVGTADYPTIRTASNSPLARDLFRIQGVRSVFFGPDFVTITKADAIDWAVLRPEVFEALMEFFTTSSTPAVVLDGKDPNADTAITEDDDEVVALIKELLETRVKPAVAEDGGSVVFRGFDTETGTVSLELQGACSTCASSSVTLKGGIENMMRHYIPEVLRVEEAGASDANALRETSDEALSRMEEKLAAAGVLRA